MLCLRHATCHLPPATSRPQTPDSPHPATPCPTLPWLVVHTSKCCATYAMYNFVPQFPLGHLSHSHSPPSFLSPLYLILFFSHSQVSLAHAFRLSSCHAHRIFSYIFFGLLVLNYPSTLFTHTYSTCRMRGCVAIIVANVANEHFYLPHLGVTIMSTISGVFNEALYLLSV